MFFVELLIKALSQTALSFAHNWPYLVLSVVIAALMKLYLDQDKVAAFLKRYSRLGVVASTAVGVTTPLCSCGTTAVILGMIAGNMAWAPILAFMVASPLTSPEELFYTAGLFGWPFSWAFYIASIALGLLGGLVAYQFEAWGWLKNQARFKPIRGASGLASNTAPAAAVAKLQRRVTWQAAGKELFQTGRQLVFFFFSFAFIGYLINGLIPAGWITAVFGGGHIYSVPLAATLGLPLYVNTEASMPLVRALLDAGMSPGAALAFLITGAGTSIGAIAGALTIARWRVIGLVVGTLWVGAIIAGYAYNFMHAAGLF
jgi:uncharacterized membrane protein YraQ (UPF0718 family)